MNRLFNSKLLYALLLIVVVGLSVNLISRQSALMSKKQELKELEESNEFIDDKTSSHSDDEYVSLQIKQNDLQKVKKLLQARGIYFKIEG